jgi:hypothetical protein
MKKLLLLSMLFTGGCAWGQPIVRSPWTTQTTPTSASANTITITTTTLLGNTFAPTLSQDTGNDVLYVIGSGPHQVTSVANAVPAGLFLKDNMSFAPLSGDGSAIVNLVGNNIASGTVADARLSANVALLNAGQTFTGANIMNNAGNTFTGVGTALTALNANNITSGTVAPARLGSGTANSTTALFGDSTYKSVTSAAAHEVQAIWIFTGPQLGLTNSAGFMSLLGTNGVGSKTITSAMVNVGSTIRSKSLGRVQNASGGNQTCNVLMDGVTIVGSAAVNPGGLTPPFMTVVEATLTFQATGASGKVIGYLSIVNIQPAGNNVLAAIGSPVTIDTTVSHVFEVIFSPNASGPSNFIFIDQAMVDYTP